MTASRASQENIIPGGLTIGGIRSWRGEDAKEVIALHERNQLKVNIIKRYVCDAVTDVSDNGRLLQGFFSHTESGLCHVAFRLYFAAMPSCHGLVVEVQHLGQGIPLTWDYVDPGIMWPLIQYHIMKQRPPTAVLFIYLSNK